MLAELGWPGLALALTALFVPLGVAVRRLLGPERHAHGAFLAAGLALLVHAAADWDWEMPGVFIWLPCLAGIVCAARQGRTRLAEPRRLTRVLAGLGCLLLFVTPGSVALSSPPLDRATRAFRAGDCAVATDAALDSLGTFKARPEPFELLGYCDIRAGQRALAVDAMRAAQRRDPSNWEYAYGLAIALALNGEDPRQMAELAVRLNPMDENARILAAGLRRGGRAHWARTAAMAQVPSQ